MPLRINTKGTLSGEEAAMALLKSAFGGWGGILVGVGIGVVAPAVLPALTSTVGSLAKVLVKGVVTVSDRIVALAGNAMEEVDELVAEVRTEGNGAGNGSWTATGSARNPS